jgi:hypothetical protein
MSRTVQRPDGIVPVRDAPSIRSLVKLRLEKQSGMVPCTAGLFDRSSVVRFFASQIDSGIVPVKPFLASKKRFSDEEAGSGGRLPEI